jgi:hypothetical protein
MDDAPDALSLICQASDGFDVEALTAANERYPIISMDAAPRKAMLQTGPWVKKLPQVKRRNRDDAISEVTRYMVCGYRLARYLLGTFEEQLLYSSLATEQANADQLKDYLDSRHPDLAILEAPLDPEVKEFITEGARRFPEGTIIEQLFDARSAEALCLTSQLAGMKVALGEWDIFCSTWD